MRPIDADALTAWVISELRAMPNGVFNNLNGRQAANLIGRAIDEAQTIGGWISVKDRLPEQPAQCLVYSDKAYRPRGMETATYTKLGWMTAAYFPEITHWMPLPEPPEEAKP